MIIYRYFTKATAAEVHTALTENNDLRAKIGLNLGYDGSHDDNYIALHDSGWPEEYEKSESGRDNPSPHMEYLILERKNNETIIFLAFYYDVLIMKVETTIDRSTKRRLLFEKALKDNFADLKSHPMNRKQRHYRGLIHYLTLDSDET